MTNKLAGEVDRRVLATDLDGTLIPLAGNAQNKADLRTLAQELEQNNVTLVFSTGRHFESVVQAIEQFDLPQPDWVICDVGTSILQRQANRVFEPLEAYQSHQAEIIAAMPIHDLRDRLLAIDGLRLQEEEKQGRFKLSYYVDAEQIDHLVELVQRELDRTGAPYSIIHSVDPFNGDGLIDLLPASVSKAHALDWWGRHTGLNAEDIVFAGDSGNDLAALTAGHRAIVVANADQAIVQQAYQEHREAGWKNRLFLARDNATSGVLEGCRWFGLTASADAPSGGLGATPTSHDQTHFRVWAPRRQRVAVEVIDHGNSTRHALTRQDSGYFVGTAPVGSHARYQYVLDDDATRPDPASRYQPDGVHGPSEIINPHSFPWTDSMWKGVAKRDLIIYELHIGAFTEEGTFRAAIDRLPELVELGVTAVELMPVAQSPGRWNWGYDGVDLFAVRNTYGEPDDFKAFVDACHSGGLAVILDVVYNHLGPEGNYLADFGPYFSRKHHTPWGEAFNFDGRHAQHVRQFIIENAIRWLDEYHLDGLRLDAVHFMLDDRKTNILAEIRQAVSHYAATTDRGIHLIAEANVFDPELLDAENGRTAYDAIWCDCLMHAIYSHALPDLQVSHREYRGAADLVEVLRRGYVYQFAGDRPIRVSEEAREINHAHVASFVTALQTHDGVGNHPHGKRLHQLTSKAFQKAAAAITLLFPSVPLIFMGEELATDAAFPFFADFEDPHLREAVDAGRASEYPHHDWEGALSPSDPRAFLSAKQHRATDRDEEVFAWYRDLIKLRKEGFAEGWLCPSRLTSTYDPEVNLFSLRFAGKNGTHIAIQSRLVPVHKRQTAPAPSAALGELLHSSEPIMNDGNGHILIRPNQAVIWRCNSD